MKDRVSNVSPVVIMSRKQAEKIAREVWETLQEDPSLKSPPSLADLVHAEMNGKVWNFETGQFEEGGR